MSQQRKTPTADEIRSLIEQVDGQLREAERLRNFANERNRRIDFFPDRRKTPRIPAVADHDHSGDQV
jgi:hypothetical protein